MTHALISPAEAHDFMAASLGTIVLDATFGVPNAHALYMAAHIPGARFFDIEAASDHSAAYPHTLPSPEYFADVVSRLGITNNSEVLIYDQNGITFAAARAWWMFRVFGHERVRIINGGLPAWAAANLPLESGPVPVTIPGDFTATFQPDLYRSYDDVETASETGSETIIDARPAPRFGAPARTLDGDPVPSHIPGSINLPFATLLDSTGAMRRDSEVADILKSIAPGTDKKRIVSCGSGITACILALGFFQSGDKNTAVFDGSWTEWSDRQQIRS